MAMATTLAESRTGSLSLSRYEWLRVKAGFDILNISPLTSLHIGRAAVEYFITDPSRLTQLLRYKQWSYLSYLPSRYGHGSCLDHATDCVVARLRQMVSPATHYDEARVVSLYVKALKSLQLALDDPSQCLQPETLCATELLTLFEVCQRLRSVEMVVRYDADAWVFSTALRQYEGSCLDTTCKRRGSSYRASRPRQVRNGIRESSVYGSRRPNCKTSLPYHRLNNSSPTPPR